MSLKKCSMNIEDFVKKMWSVTGESQYIGEQKEIYHQGFSDAVAMMVIELEGTPENEGFLKKNKEKELKKFVEAVRISITSSTPKEQEELNESFLQGLELFLEIYKKETV